MDRVRLGVIRLFDELRRKKKEKKRSKSVNLKEKIVRFLKFEIVIRGRGDGGSFSREFRAKTGSGCETWRTRVTGGRESKTGAERIHFVVHRDEHARQVKKN